MECRSEIENVDEVTKRVKISIPPETFKAEFDTVIVELTRTTRVKGFREGKAPRQLVEKLHGERAKYEVANRLISSSLQDVIKKNSYEVVGQPDIDIASLDPAKEIEITAQLSLFPKPEIKSYEKIAVEVPIRSVTDEDVQQIIDRMLTQKSTTKKLDFRTTAQKGDIIDASLQVEVVGEEPSRPEPLFAALGEGLIPSELDEGIVGQEIGEVREIKGKIPEDHREEKLRGKDAIYKITLNALSEKKLPELNDEFVASLEIEPKTVLELRADVRKRQEEENERSKKSDVHTALLDVLLEANPFQVPQVLVDDEMRNLLSRMGIINPSKMNVEELNMEPFREHLGETARKRVRTSVLVDRIAEQEKMTANEEDLNKAFGEIAAQNGVTIEDVKRYYNTKERILQLALDLTRDRVLQFLEERAEVKMVEPKESGAAESEGSEPKAKSSGKKKKKEA